MVVYVSSHGTPPDKFGGVYVRDLRHGGQPPGAGLVRGGGIRTEDFVENLRARRLVMVLDTCYSNGYWAIPGFLPPGGKSLGVGMRTRATVFPRPRESGFAARASSSRISPDRPHPRAKASGWQPAVPRPGLIGRAAQARNPGNRINFTTASLLIISWTG